jgi:hypothetical protein
MMMRMGYVMVRASMFPGLKQDDPVTVNGVAYRAAIPQLIQDGKMLQIMLGKA